MGEDASQRRVPREQDEDSAEVSQELFISACASPPLPRHPAHPGSAQAGVCPRSWEQEASALGEGEHWGMKQERPRCAGRADVTLLPSPGTQR